MKECMKSRPNPTAKFNYAWALIRSKEVRCDPGKKRRCAGRQASD